MSPLPPRFSVVQFNILGKTLAEAKWFPHAKQFLPGVAQNAVWTETAGFPSHLQWDGPNGRLALLVEQIKKLDADVVCMQEMDAFPEFQEALAQYGYAGEYLQRPNGRADGCAVFWRLTEFTKDDSFHLNYSDRSERVALLMQLRQFPSGKLLTVACTHLHWDRKAGVHEQQLQELREAMQRLPFVGSAAVIAGDFNNQSSSAAISHFLATSQFRSAHEVLGQVPHSTSYTPDNFYHTGSEWRYKQGRDDEVIDFILCDQQLEPTAITQCHILPDYSCGDTQLDLLAPDAACPAHLPQDDPLGKWCPPRTAVPLTGLPNAHCGSDHVPLMATFQFR
mmetsp:Transcript_71560/g.125945  ORF Transcript_71560/g.125945 Transcript_71560/m.125945 type:complete len:336 (-) Transcript_71560:112-1119(-)